MNINQIYEIVNEINQQTMGEKAVAQVDASNVVDVGSENLTSIGADKYVGKLIDAIGRRVFVNRAYQGNTPSVLMTSTEWGSVTQKISSEIPTVSVNETYTLKNGQSYDPNVVNLPSVNSKYFDKYVTFEIDRTIAERQVRSAFNSPDQLNSFVSMLFNEIEKGMTVSLDNLIMSTISSAIGDTLYTAYDGGARTSASHPNAVNLLYLYNQQTGESLTAAKAITTPEFIRFASYIIGMYPIRMRKMSTLFNQNGKERFTPTDELHFIMLSEFARSAGAYLQSDTFHDEYTAIKGYEEVPYWQGSGVDYAFSSTSSINLITGGGNTVNASGILAVMFDRWSLGVVNLERWTNSHFNPKADFVNYFYKFKAGYFNDPDENFVVFFVE